MLVGTVPKRQLSLFGCRLASSLLVEVSRLSSPFQGESRYSQHQRRVWSDGSNGWTRLSVSSCTIIGQTAVVATVISPAYHTISSAYQLRSLGMTGFWEGSADRSHNMHTTQPVLECYIQRDGLDIPGQVQSCLLRIPHTGCRASVYYVNRLLKFLSFFIGYTAITQTLSLVLLSFGLLLEDKTSNNVRHDKNNRNLTPVP